MHQLNVLRRVSHSYQLHSHCFVSHAILYRFTAIYSSDTKTHTNARTVCCKNLVLYTSTANNCALGAFAIYQRFANCSQHRPHFHLTSFPPLDVCGGVKVHLFALPRPSQSLSSVQHEKERWTRYRNVRTHARTHPCPFVVAGSCEWIEAERLQCTSASFYRHLPWLLVEVLDHEGRQNASSKMVHVGS